MEFSLLRKRIYKNKWMDSQYFIDQKGLLFKEKEEFNFKMSFILEKKNKFKIIIEYKIFLDITNMKNF